jgi:hypothetical protein
MPRAISSAMREMRGRGRVCKDGCETTAFREPRGANSKRRASVGVRESPTHDTTFGCCRLLYVRQKITSILLVLTALLIFFDFFFDFFDSLFSCACMIRRIGFRENRTKSFSTFWQLAKKFYQFFTEAGVFIKSF